MKDGSSMWLPLKDLKESYPIQVAEYAVANKIADEPAFRWWIKHVLKKRDRMISKVKTHYWKKMVKYGIKLPHSVKEALQFDRDSGTTFWRDTITKEMRNVMPAFKILEGDELVPVGYKHIDCHMIFDIKLEGLVRKARFVGGGHQTDPPKASVFSSVVSCDSVRIMFTIAALNDLPILSCDVQSAYLHAPTKEKVYTTAGLEFGASQVGKSVLIVRALYGLLSSGARWRDHMDFVRSQGDPDVWMRPAVKPNASYYYEYVLVYVDDLLAISLKAEDIMDGIKKVYPLKAGSLKEPDQYLGAEIKKWNIHDSKDPTKTRWAISAEKYIKSVKRDIEARLDSYGMRFSTKAKTPFSSASYRPELDETPELDDDKALWYMAIIGILRWCLELGRVDIRYPYAGTDCDHEQEFSRVACSVYCQCGCSGAVRETRSRGFHCAGKYCFERFLTAFHSVFPFFRQTLQRHARRRVHSSGRQTLDASMPQLPSIWSRKVFVPRKRPFSRLNPTTSNKSFVLHFQLAT